MKSSYEKGLTKRDDDFERAENAALSDPLSMTLCTFICLKTQWGTLETAKTPSSLKAGSSSRSYLRKRRYRRESLGGGSSEPNRGGPREYVSVPQQRRSELNKDCIRLSFGNSRNQNARLADQERLHAVKF